MLEKGESTLNIVPFLEKKQRNKAVALAIPLLLGCNQGHDFRLWLKYLIIFFIPTASGSGHPLSPAPFLGSLPPPSDRVRDCILPLAQDGDHRGKISLDELNTTLLSTLIKQRATKITEVGVLHSASG